MFLVGSPLSGRVGIRFYKLNPLHMIERRVEPDLREGLGKHGRISLFFLGGPRPIRLL